jgi:nicotinamidase-related amidase
MNTAFIGLDYIFDIVHPEGVLAQHGGYALDDSQIERVNEALAISREKGWLNILVKVALAPGYVNQPKDSPIFGGAHKVGSSTGPRASTSTRSFAPISPTWW